MINPIIAKSMLRLAELLQERANWFAAHDRIVLRRPAPARPQWRRVGESG